MEISPWFEKLNALDKSCEYLVYYSIYQKLPNTPGGITTTRVDLVQLRDFNQQFFNTHINAAGRIVGIPLNRILLVKPVARKQLKLEL